MILYKYFSCEGKNEEEKRACFLNFLKKPYLRFTPPKYFNDPFEARPTSSVLGSSYVAKSHKHFYEGIYRTQYNVLCLTRSPLNKLMWAHYAQDHTGYVLGINVNHEVFSNHKTCTIPVQFGNVIYTTTRPTNTLINNTKNPYQTIYRNYSLDNAEHISRCFLYKSLDWAYEEEVRIVKYFGDYGTYPGDTNESIIELKKYFDTPTINGSKMFDLKIKKNWIKEIYIGANNSVVQENIIEDVSKDLDGCKLYKCHLNDYEWNLRCEEIRLSQRI
ncbi:DUF2971 domain-containing protein [Maridesulfovibrio salexigens]|uniref:DUF2971 domain-containing protein n=1 Tax=Maridesulfovibrio salexigens (strain ATCC 14822 / DSM 2638 / NCIMB 8403 / VKM B-1763) TaxID=526222 RepID=C6BYW0_MARSD|nr:DUF2971 domain-containing protein [Maridesulfovibrio salexigens]ACS80717.1 conserved hypothetical protein [Maridesulfovibrio salexigens DSM 2638]